MIRADDESLFMIHRPFGKLWAAQSSLRVLSYVSRLVSNWGFPFFIMVNRMNRALMAVSVMHHSMVVSRAYLLFGLNFDHLWAETAVLCTLKLSFNYFGVLIGWHESIISWWWTLMKDVSLCLLLLLSILGHILLSVVAWGLGRIHAGINPLADKVIL